MRKQCFKCKRTKPTRMFYHHPMMADGHLNKCKACAKKDVARRYYSPGGRKKVLAYERLRNQTDSRKAARKIYQQRRRLGRPGVEAAHTAVCNAVRDGRLVRQPCAVCNNPKSEAHHDDYRKKLSVRWLCFKHHREAHGQIVGLI